MQLISQHQESYAKQNHTHDPTYLLKYEVKHYFLNKIILGFFHIVLHRSPSASWAALAVLPASQGRRFFTCAKHWNWNSSPTSGLFRPRQTGRIGDSLEQVHRDDSDTGASDIQKEVQRVGTCSWRVSCTSLPQRRGLAQRDLVSILSKYLTGENEEGETKPFLMVPTDRT